MNSFNELEQRVKDLETKMAELSEVARPKEINLALDAGKISQVLLKAIHDNHGA